MKFKQYMNKFLFLDINNYRFIYAKSLMLLSINSTGYNIYINM